MRRIRREVNRVARSFANRRARREKIAQRRALEAQSAGSSGKSGG